MTKIRDTGKIIVTISGARGDLGIDLADTPVPGEFLVKAPGGGRRYLTSSGTGNDPNFRTDTAQPDGAKLLGYLNSTVYHELGKVVWVDLHGAKGDYDPATGTGTDDSAAFLAAAQSLGRYGGTVLIPPGFRCLIDSDLWLPDSVIIQGNGRRNVMQIALAKSSGGTLPVAEGSGDLYVKPGASIITGGGGGLRQCVVFRKGIQFAITSAQLLAQFKGTAIKLNGAWDCIIDDVVVGGFENGIISFAQEGADQCNRTRFLGRNFLHNWNDINIYNAYDVGTLEGAIHCWPFITYSSVGEPDGEPGITGTGIWLHGVNDWTKATNAFTYGKRIGFRITDCRSVTMEACGADYPAHSKDGSIGFLVEGATAELRLIAPQVAAHDTGIYIASTSPLMVCQIISPNLWDNRVNGIAVIQGDSQIIGGSVVSSYPGAIGVQTGGYAGRVNVIGMDFRGVDIAFSNDNPSVQLTWSHCTFDDVPVPSNNGFTPAVTAADPLPIDPSFTGGQLYIVNGSSNFGTIANAPAFAGKLLTLRFTGTPTVLDSANLLLNGNFVAKAGSTLTLASDGSTWAEVSRSNNG